MIYLFSEAGGRNEPNTKNKTLPYNSKSKNVENV